MNSQPKRRRKEEEEEEEAVVNDQYQQISDTLVEVAAEIAPQGKRKKQITEERKRSKSPEAQEKMLHKRLHILYT